MAKAAAFLKKHPVSMSIVLTSLISRGGIPVVMAAGGGIPVAPALIAFDRGRFFLRPSEVAKVKPV